MTDRTMGILAIIAAVVNTICAAVATALIVKSAHSDEPGLLFLYWVVLLANMAVVYFSIYEAKRLLKE